MNVAVKGKGSQRRYSPELKERAVRLVLQLREETGEKQGSVKRVADEIGARPSIGTVADSYDNALAETVNGLYKTECVYGPDATGWDDVDQLELATLSWVHWFNHQRLHSHCDPVPPAELEDTFCAAQEADREVVGIQ